MDINGTTISAVTTWINAHPHLSVWIVFLTTFTESLALIGMLVPGSVALIVIGVLMGIDVLPIPITFVAAVCGTLLGSFLSFWFGMYFQGGIKDIWPFTRYPALLQKSVDFLQTHGGKSVFLGSFIGPIRPILPMVAGMLKMPVKRFVVAEILASLLLAPAYLLPGILLGVSALQYEKNTATTIIFIILVSLIIIWISKNAVKSLVLKTARAIDKFYKRLWSKVIAKPHSPFFENILVIPHNRQDYRQLFLLTVVLLLIVLLMLLISNLKLGHILNDINSSLHQFLINLRLPKLDKMALSLTIFGEAMVIVGLGGAVGAYLLYLKQYHTLRCWVLNGFLIGTMTFIAKVTLDLARPTDIEVIRSTGSFPSAHAATSIAVFGFLAIIIGKRLSPLYRKVLSISMIVFLAMVSMSRVYLGAHWMSDILGGAILAGITMTFMLIFYRRVNEPINIKHLSLVSITAVIVTWCVFFYFFFDDIAFEYQKFVY